MTKSLKLNLAVAITLMIALCSSSSVFATDTNADDEIVSTESTAETSTNTVTPRSNSFPYNSISNALTVSTTYKTIATSTTGFNCNVHIAVWNTSIGRVSVRMLDKNGNTVWEETGAIPMAGYRVFICGSDVYTIQVKTVSGTATVYAYQTSEDPT